MTRLAIVALALLGLSLLGRRFRVEPRDPAPTDDIDWMTAWRT